MLRDSRQSKAGKRVSGGRAKLYRCTGAAITEECSCLTDEKNAEKDNKCYGRQFKADKRVCAAGRSSTVARGRL